MSNSEKYDPWVHISIRHEYYTKAPCPVAVIPAPKTKYLLKRHNLLFLNQRTDEWLILKEKKTSVKDLLEEGVELLFEIRPQMSSFYHLTLTEPQQQNAFSMKESPFPHVWQELKLNLSSIAEKEYTDIPIFIHTFSKYFEYICIPKYHSKNSKIKLLEEKNRVFIEELEMVNLPDMPRAHRFITKEKITLNQHNELRIQLWEIRPEGERIISNQLPHPDPEESSMFDPKNSITTYFHF